MGDGTLQKKRVMESTMGSVCYTAGVLGIFTLPRLSDGRWQAYTSVATCARRRQQQASRFGSGYVGRG